MTSSASNLLLWTCLVLFPVWSGSSPAPRFQTHTVDDGVQIGYGVAVGDVDGDGRPDLVLADKKQFVWYRNPDWQKFVILEDLTERDNVCLAVRDLHGDGHVELAVGAQWNPRETSDPEKSGSVHYLIRPSDPRKAWTPVRLHHEPTVHRMRWLRISPREYQLVVVPLHGRGNQNGEGAGVRVLAYSIPADPQADWPTELVDDSLHITHNFEVTQWDQDPEEEILLAGREGVFLLDRQASGWSKTAIAGGERGGAGEVRSGSLGSTRFVATIEPWHGHQLAVYLESSAWKRVQLDDTLRQGHALAVADFLGLGRDQIAAGWREADERGRVGIKLFVPAGPTGTQWDSFLVDDNTMACEDLAVADLDADGRPDLVAAGRDTHNLVIYWNRTGTE